MTRDQRILEVSDYDLSWPHDFAMDNIAYMRGKADLVRTLLEEAKLWSDERQTTGS